MCYLWGEKCHIHLVNITFQLSQIFFYWFVFDYCIQGNICPSYFCSFYPYWQLVNLRLVEFQCLKLSFLKHNFVCVNSKTATLFVSVEVWKLHGEKITLYTVVSKSVTWQLLLARQPVQITYRFFLMTKLLSIVFKIIKIKKIHMFMYIAFYITERMSRCACFIPVSNYFLVDEQVTVLFFNNNAVLSFWGEKSVQASECLVW